MRDRVGGGERGRKRGGGRGGGGERGRKRGGGRGGGGERGRKRGGGGRGRKRGGGGGGGERESEKEGRWDERERGIVIIADRQMDERRKEWLPGLILNTVSSPPSSSKFGIAELKSEVPDTITTWNAEAFAISRDVGLGISPITELTVKKDLFVSLELPYNIIFAESVTITPLVFYFGSEEFIQVHDEPQLPIAANSKYSRLYV